MTRDWEMTITHVFREANRCADTLAQIGLGLWSKRVLWSNPPHEVERCLEDDIEGRKFLRPMT